MFGKKSEPGSLQKLSLEQLYALRNIDEIQVIEEEDPLRIDSEFKVFHGGITSRKKNAFKLPIAFGLVTRNVMNRSQAFTDVINNSASRRNLGNRYRREKDKPKISNI